MNAPDRLTVIEQRLERVEGMLERLTSLLDQGPGAIAIAADTADELVREASARGVDVDERLRAASDALVRLTEPRTLAALVRLSQQAERLETVVGLAASFEDYVAIAGDVADELADDEARAGRPVDDRLHAGLALLARVTEPETLGTLERLAAQARGLEPLVSLAASFEDNLAIFGDIADEWFRQRAEAGHDPDEAATELQQLAGRLGDPQVIRALRVLVDQAPLLATQLYALEDIARERGVQPAELLTDLAPSLGHLVGLVHDGTLRRLVESPLLEAAFLEAVARIGVAAAEALEHPAPPAGLFGTLGAMRDPDVQRAMGAGISMARHVGASLDQPLVRK